SSLISRSTEIVHSTACWSVPCSFSAGTTTETLGRYGEPPPWPSSIAVGSAIIACSAIDDSRIVLPGEVKWQRTRSRDEGPPGLGPRFNDRGLLKLIPLTDENLHQILEIDQRPDEEAPVRNALKVLVDQSLHGFAIEVVVDTRVAVVQEAPNIIDALALEPRAVRAGESLLLPICDVLRNIVLHHFPQHDLAVAEPTEILLTLLGNITLVDPGELGEVSELLVDRKRDCKVDQIIVEKRYPCLERMRHAHLVFDHEETVQKRARLEVKRAVDIVLWAKRLPALRREDILENIAGRGTARLMPNRLEDVGLAVVWNEPLPEVVILHDVVIKIIVAYSPVIAPRIAAEDFIAAGARENDLDELACELRGVEDRITLANPWLLEMPDQALHNSFHIARFEYHLIVFGLELIRHALGGGALVETQLHARGGAQIKTAGERLDIRVLRGCDRRDRAGVHAAAEVGTDLDVAD